MYFLLYYILLYRIISSYYMLCYNALYYIILYYIILYYIILYHTILLCYVMLYYIVLYCIIRGMPRMKQDFAGGLGVQGLGDFDSFRDASPALISDGLPTCVLRTSSAVTHVGEPETGFEL